MRQHLTRTRHDRLVRRTERTTTRHDRTTAADRHTGASLGLGLRLG